jgi:hypothetical protein
VNPDLLTSPTASNETPIHAAAVHQILLRTGGWIESRGLSGTVVRRSFSAHRNGCLLAATIVLLVLWDYYAWAWVVPSLAALWLVARLHPGSSQAHQAWLRSPWKSTVVGIVTTDDANLTTQRWH